MEGLLRRMGHFAMFPPGVKAIVDDEARQMGEREISRGDCRAIGGRPRKEFARSLHRRFLNERHLMPLHKLPPPPVNLLVNVDLNRTDVGAAAVERRREGQVAVFVCVEGWVDDKADWAGIGGAVAQPPAAPVNWAGVHAGSAADALERCPELRHAETPGAAVVDQHNMHLATVTWPPEMRRVLRNRRA